MSDNVTQEEHSAGVTEHEDTVTSADANNADVTAKDGDTTAENKTSEGDVLDSVKAEEKSGDVLADADNTEPESVPDSYTFEEPEDGLPEGIELNEGQLESYMAIAKDVGLSQDQFQKLVEYSLEQTQASSQEANEAWNARVQSWRDAAAADAEFGGENYDANVRNALKAIDQFGDNEFKALLQSPSESNPEGLAIGNHPAVLRFLNRIGKAYGDPNFVSGNESKAEMTDDKRLARLYPSMS